MSKPRICPAANVLNMGTGTPKVDCRIAREYDDNAILFDPNDCYHNELCSLWRNHKHQLWKRTGRL